MEKKTMLLHLVPKGAVVQIETCFLIGDRSIAMALYQNCLFCKRNWIY